MAVTMYQVLLYLVTYFYLTLSTTGRCDYNRHGHMAYNRKKQDWPMPQPLLITPLLKQATIQP